MSHKNVAWRMSYFKADAQKVADEIMSLNEITPQEIVDYARNKNTELHKCFTWDDTEAAEKWRKQEARILLSQLRIVDPKTENTPSMIRVFYKSEISSSYQPTQMIIRNEDEYQNLLNRAINEARIYREKYSKLSELSEVFEAIDIL